VDGDTEREGQGASRMPLAVYNCMRAVHNHFGHSLVSGHFLSITQDVLKNPTLWEEIMTPSSDPATETNHRERIWFFPDKFWRATKNMAPDEVANLMAEVESYATAGDVQALRKYPFVVVGDPYKKKKALA
jgi:hypothetical protein